MSYRYAACLCVLVFRAIATASAITLGEEIGRSQSEQSEESADRKDAFRFEKTRLTFGWPSTWLRVDEHLKAVRTSANLSTISNDEITLGVDLNRGASITYLSKKGVDESVINVYDMGREVQLSFYAGPPDYEPSPGSTACKSRWRPQGNWPWNPIGAGDVAGHSGTVVELKNNGSSIYVKTKPLQWSCDDVFCECTFEKWITLDGSSVNVTARLNNARSDTTFYGAFGQELPAVYSIGSLYRLFSYNQTKPFTEDSLTEFTTGSRLWTPGAFLSSEHWAALVNKGLDLGLGVFHPGNYHFTGGFAGKPGSGGPNDDPTGYIAPNHREILDHNVQYTFQFWLILGSLQNIRQKAYELRNADPQMSQACLGNHFTSDRQHWWPINAEDNGIPDKHWHVKMEQNDPQLFGPSCLWNAEEYHYIIINASYSIQQASKTVSGQIFFNKAGVDGVFTEQLSLRFDVMADEHYHLYKVALSSHSFYRGPMFGLRFDPVDRGTAGCYVNIVSIILSKD